MKLGRVFLPILSIIASASLHAELAVGASGILIAGSPLTMNGQNLHSLESGQSVTILGLKADSKEAVVSVVLASGQKLVGMLPQSALIAVDTPATQTVNASVPAAPPPQPAAVAAPALDVSKVLTSVEIAQAFKTDREAAKQLFTGKRIKISGVLESASLETQSTGGNKIPVLSYRTAQGLPRVKVRMSPSVANGDAFFQKFRSHIPDWWWGASRNIDFRMNGTDQVQARAVYDRSYRTTYSDGYSSTTRHKTNTDWFTIFGPGEPINVEATFHGLYMDVEFNNGLINANPN